MRRSRTILIITTAFASLSLAGCGVIGGSKSNKSDQADASAAATAPAEPVAPTPTPPPPPPPSPPSIAEAYEALGGRTLPPEASEAEKNAKAIAAVMRSGDSVHNAFFRDVTTEDGMSYRLLFAADPKDPKDPKKVTLCVTNITGGDEALDPDSDLNKVSARMCDFGLDGGIDQGVGFSNYRIVPLENIAPYQSESVGQAIGTAKTADAWQAQFERTLAAIRKALPAATPAALSAITKPAKPAKADGDDSDDATGNTQGM